MIQFKKSLRHKKNNLYISFLLLQIISISFSANAQIILSDNENEILKEICNQYNTPIKESSLKEKYKTAPERFQIFIDQMVATKSKPKKIIETKYLNRPSHENLVYWYIVREFHYNNSAPDSLKKSQDEIMEWILKDTIDERWLLSNYYYRISGRLMFLFNKADLSKYNFEIDKLGFFNETEKAIFFLYFINSFGKRLTVMNFTGKGDKKSVIDRLPKINGKEYFYYTDFNYPDFTWIGYQKVESFNERHIGNLYEMLVIHLNLLFENNLKSEAIRLFQNSILSIPEYYKYSGLEDQLNELYRKMN